jgi:hypothetical protein
MICFGLAERLGVDVSDVLDWPYEKIIAWMAYFRHADRLRSEKQK